MFYQRTFFDQSAASVEKCLDNQIFFSDGKVLSDFTGGLTSHSVWPWGDQNLVDAVSEQLLRYPHLDYKYFYDPLRDKLAKILIDAIPFSGIEEEYSVFFPGLSGGDGLEAAVKLSYQYHCARGNPSKVKVLSFRESYHGSTFGALSYGDRPNLALYDRLTPKNNIKLPEVNHVRAGLPMLEHRAQSLEMLRRTIIEVGAENICCIVGESIAGGLTGFVPKPDGYWREVLEIARQHQIHLVLDEVICGTSTSGSFYCCEQDGMFPDLLVLGKTLAGGYFPLNAIICRKSIFEEIKNGDGRIQQSNTFQGHSAAIAAAIYIQTYLSRPEFTKEILTTGAELAKEISGRLSGFEGVPSVAGRGLRFSIQFGAGADRFCRTVASVVERDHQMLIDGKWHRISFSPQLLVRKESLQRCIDVTLDVCKRFRHLLNDRSGPLTDPQLRTVG